MWTLHASQLLHLLSSVGHTQYTWWLQSKHLHLHHLSPVSTTWVDGWPVSITCQHGPCWRVCVSNAHPSTRPVLTGNGNRSPVNSGIVNRALVTTLYGSVHSLSIHNWPCIENVKYSVTNSTHNVVSAFSNISQLLPLDHQSRCNLKLCNFIIYIITLVSFFSSNAVLLE